MAKDKKYGLREIKAEFPTEAYCLAYLFDRLHTRKCSCGGLYAPLKGRRQFQCSKCRYQIAPMAGTIFHKSSTPLLLWFHAIFIFSNAKSGISAKEMERQLNVTYKTAWRILFMIRKCLGQDGEKLNGIVEMDEAFFGGRGHGGKYNKNASRVMEEKSKVIAAIQRGGRVKSEVVQTISSITLKRFLDKNVKPEGTNLMTDGSGMYDGVSDTYSRASVNHKKKEFVRGPVHVNNVEGYWSHLRRSIQGTFKGVSKRHLQSYLDSFAFHYNNRHNDRERFSVLLGRILKASA